MAYYLAVETERDNYIALNVKKSGYFGKQHTYEEACKCTLSEIDKYTTKFSDEGRLRTCLYSEGLLLKEHKNNKLVIIESQDKARYEIIGFPLFKQSAKFINQKDLIQSYLIELATEKDTTFFHELSLHGNIKLTAKSLIQGFYDMLDDVPVDKKGIQDILTEIIKILLYQYKIDSSGNFIYSDDYDEVQFHNLIDFIEKYESQNPLTTIKRKTKTHELI